jgi:hypothetical protein
MLCIKKLSLVVAVRDAASLFAASFRWALAVFIVPAKGATRI